MPWGDRDEGGSVPHRADDSQGVGQGEHSAGSQVQSESPAVDKEIATDQQRGVGHKEPSGTFMQGSPFRPQVPNPITCIRCQATTASVLLICSPGLSPGECPSRAAAGPR